MRHRDLWKLIVEALEDFHTSQITPPPVGTTRPPAEDFIGDVIEQQYDISSDESSFLRECFLGTLRYEHVCEGVLQGFCDALKRNKQDRYTMYLIAYLVVYRFTEVGGRFLRSLMDKSTSTTRLAEYVGYLLDEEKMITFATPVLRQWYDDRYIRDFVIGNIQKHKVEADRDVLQYFLSKATNPGAVSDEDADGALGDVMAQTNSTAARTRTFATVKSTKPLTVAVAPKISQGVVRERDAALRQVPPVDVREMLSTVKPPKPPAIDVPPPGTISLDGPKPQKDPLAAPSVADRPFIETKRPMHRSRLLEEKEAREAAVFEPDPVMRTRLMPDEVREKFAKMQSSAPQVKQTTASIRREELLYRRRDEHREAELLRKAQEMRDDSEYQTWKQQQEETARVERDTRISERKLELMLADEEAKLAKFRQEQQNLAVAQDFRRVMTAWRETAAREESAERNRKISFAAQLRQEVQEQVELAQRQVQQEKKAAAVIVKSESHQNELKTAATMELERQRKSALIAEIRTLQEKSIKLRPQAIEQCREARCKELGIMDTMSIEELKDKLAQVRNEHETLEFTRRAEFQNCRTNQRNELQQMKERCETERHLYLDAKEQERHAKRQQAATQAEKQRVVEEARLIELHTKLQKARQERKDINDRRKEEERQRKVEAMLLAGDAGAMEAKKWGEMERGVDNRILREQNTRVTQLKKDRTKASLMSNQRETNIVCGTMQHATARALSDQTSMIKNARAQEDRAYDDNVRTTAIDAARQERAAMRTRTA